MSHWVPLRFATVRTACMAAFVFVAGSLAAQDAQPSRPATATPSSTPGASTTPAAASKPGVATKKKKAKRAAAEDDAEDTADTADTTGSTTPLTSSTGVSSQATLRSALTSTPLVGSAARSSSGVTTLAIAPGDPRYPLPAEPTRAGLIMGTGGLVGSVGGALSPTLTSLLNPNSQYLTSGALNLASVNVTGTFQTVGIGSLGLVNLTPVGATINGTVIGQNQHLTLLGGVTSASYITNINRGTDGFYSNGIGGILLPSGGPAWSTDCASLLGIPLSRCWAVNPAQDNQVIVGDKASANGSQEVVIGRGASHTLPAEDANTVFPGSGRNDPNNPSGVPTNDFAARKGNSVVVGDSASGTANAQTIVGANATSSQVNSVVLGNGSVGDRPGAANYAAFGIVAPQNSVGAVSVGSTNNERQLTHVAAGTDNFDAVNVLQLKGATSQIAALNLLAVTYDPDGNGLPTNSITLSGAGVGTGAVGLHNVAAGSLGAGSLDAINGTQLNTTNQAVAAYFGGTTAVGATGVFTAPTFTAPAISATGVVTPGTTNNVNAAFNTVGNSLTALNTRINGLGTTGLAYLKINSTGAASSATGLDAIALGAGAVAANGNSIALGAGSTTTVGAQTGYTAIGVTPPQTSLGEIAVGTRKITGLAAGSAAGDAVNVAQLTGVNNAVTALGRLAVHYDSDGLGNATNRVTLSGTGVGNVALGNLANGAVTAASTDAVNGAQLNTTNQAVAAYFGGTTAASATGAFTAPTFNVQRVDANGSVTTGTYGDVTSMAAGIGTSLGNVNTRINNLYSTGLKYLAVNSTGLASAASGVDSIALGAGASATNGNSIALGAGSVTSVGAQTGYTAIGLAAAQNSTGEIAVGARKLTGVAAGSALGDAVNVAQLTGVSNSVDALGRLAVRYDDDGAGNPLNRISLVGSGAGSVTLGNVAAGATTAGSLEAINGGQFLAANAALAGYLGAGAAFTGATGTFTGPVFPITVIGTGGGTTPTTSGNVGDAFANVNTSLGNLNVRLNTLDANGSEYVVVNSTGALPAAAGAEGIAIGGATTASAANSVAIGNGATAGNANSVALGAGSATTVGAQTNYAAYGIAAPQTSLGEVNVGTRKITGVSAGSDPNDAANIAQLTAVDTSVSDLGRLAVRYDDDGAGNPTNNITLGAGPAVGIHNLAPGAIGALSADAVNGAQLFATNTAVVNWAGGGATYDPVTGVFASPSYALVTVGADGSAPSTNFTSTGTALASVNTSLGNLNARLSALGAGSGYVRVNSTGLAADAAGTEAIAVGGGSSAAAANAIAIGNGATATNADSIALGNGSATTVGAQTGYTAYGLVPTQNSAGEVNLGNRKITGVAPGTADTDAANILQLKTVSGDVGTLGQFAVRYDDVAGAPADSVTLVGTGTGQVGIHNVAAGSLAAGSADAVNGGQVNAAYASLNQSLGGGAAYDGATNIYTAPTFAISQIGADGTVGSTNAANVAAGFTATDNSLVNLNTRISTLNTAGTMYVQVNSTGPAAVAGGAESIAVGGGSSASAGNAIALGNGAQATNANSIALGNGSATTVGAQTGYTAYGLAGTQNSLGEVNVGTRKITGVAPGTLDTDAANIQQLRTVSGDVGTLGQLAVKYDAVAGNPTNSVTLVGDGTGSLVALHNVAGAPLAAGNTDAVNGGQLATTNQAVASYFGGTTAVDGTGTFTAPTFSVPAVAADGTVTTNTSNNVTGAFTALGTSVGNVNARVSTIFTTGLKYVQVNSIGLPSSATGADAVAIGPGATAGNDASVAIGANSATTVGAQANYTAFAMPTLQNSAGEVNIGNRTLSGLAAGKADNDAVNVAQLRNVSTSVGGLSLLAVRYDDAGGGTPADSVTFTGGGGGPVALRNVGAGSLATGSTEAVNGSQVNATRVAMANALGGGAAADPTSGAFTGPTFSIASVDASGNVTTVDRGSVSDAFDTTNTSLTNVSGRVDTVYNTGTKYAQVNSTGPASSASQPDSIAIGAGASALNANSIALGAGTQTGVGALSNYAAYALAAAQNSTGEVAIGNRQLTGLAAGAADHDAVNVQQLRAVSDAAGSIGAMAVSYDAAIGGGRANRISLSGGTAAPVGIGNLADGLVVANGHDAVSGGQLFAANDAMTRFFGGGAAFDPLTATFTAPSFALRPVDTNGNASSVNVGTAGAAFTSLDGSVNALNTRINSLASGFTSPYMAVQSTQTAAQASGIESTAIGGAATASAEDATAIGSLSQAVAVRSLALGTRSVASAAGGVALGADSVADRTGSGTEAFSGVAVPVEGAVSVGSDGAERQIIHVAGGTDDTDAVNLRQLRAVSDLAGSVGASAVKYDDVSHTRATLNSGGAAVSVTNVAAGNVAQGSADAVNGGQLWTWTQDASNAYSNVALFNRLAALPGGGNGTAGVAGFAVNNTNGLPDAAAGGNNSVAAGSGSSATGTNSTAVGNGAQATGENSVAVGAGSVADRANSVSVGTATQQRQITNVAAGSADTDAANVAQINAVRAAGVHYDTLADGSVDYGNTTLGAPGTPTVVHNVGAGTATTDAANVGQLNQVADWSRSYTDQKVNAINRDIEQTNNRASAGIASAMAMAGLPQALTPGRNMAAVAGGTFRGESSIAVGISTVSESGGWIYKLSGTTNSRGDAGFSVGAGMEW